MKKMVKWLKVGGYIFFRESCFHQSGDHKRKCNPTHYREPSFYTKVTLLSLHVIIFGTNMEKGSRFSHNEMINDKCYKMLNYYLRKIILLSYFILGKGTR